MKRVTRFTLFLVLWAVGLAPLQAADPYRKCVVCQQPIKDTIYLQKSPYLPGKQPICGDCFKLERECCICQLPIKTNWWDLKDGRLLCERDVKMAVLSFDEAKGIFEDVKRDVVPMFAGTKKLPYTNITFTLVDRQRLEDLYRVQRFPHPHNLTMGLTQTRSKEDGEFEHNVYVLLGLRRSAFTAVCAHEYAHTWMQENVGSRRPIDSDTVEGFCELIAYKLLAQRNEPIEQSLLLTNDYTHGQIDVFIQAEAKYRFYYVLKWIEAGVDQELNAANLSRLLVLQEESPAAVPLTWPPGQVVATPVPPTLMLKGISGSPTRRFALINDRTLAIGESAKVRVGGSNVTVRCLAISDQSVTLQVNNSPEKTVLTLRKD